MNKTLIFIFLLMTSWLANAQYHQNIIIGKIDTLHSTILNEDRILWIYTPEMTAQYPEPNKRYPVLYLLDGEAHFTSTVGMINQLSQVNGNGIVPEMMVVGITNTNRMRDLSPATVEPVKEGVTKANYRGNAFVQFLETELMPYIEKQYPAAPYKTLVGHSLGGLVALDLLTNKPDLFNAYLAIDPSMWYQNEQFLNHTMTQLPQQSQQNRRLFIGIANTMPKGMTLSKLKKDKSSETQHIRSIFKLDKFLKKHPISGLQYDSKYYDQESHVSAPLISQYDGLHFLFDYYPMDVSERDFMDTTALIAHKFRKHYEKISAEMGYKVAPPESFIDFLANDARSKKQHQKADALFKLNEENYPESNKTPEVFAVSEQVLRQYVGEYIIEAYNFRVSIVLKDGILLAKAVGQADSEFIPIAKDIFTVKDKKGYQITFEMKDGKPMSFTSVQPNGVFKAVLVK